LKYINFKFLSTEINEEEGRVDKEEGRVDKAHGMMILNFKQVIFILVAVNM
jgi:hypothetical protein